MTSKEGPELSDINLRTIQYPHGISIDKTDHIKDTIFAHWFPDAYRQDNFYSTTFKSDRKF